MPSTGPIKPDPGWVWVVLLLFYSAGIWLIVKGAQFNSRGSQIAGALLIAGGIYYSIQWFAVLRRGRRE